MNLREKNKRNGIIILVLLLGMISIGYALLSQNLNINGTSKLKNSTWSIHFDNVQVSSGSVEIDEENNDRAATIDPNDNTRVNFQVTLDKPGKYYEFTVDAVNDGSIDGKIDSVVSKLNNQVIEELPVYLNYTVTNLDGSAIVKNHLLKSGERETYKVRVEFKRDITNSQLPNEDKTISFDFNINYVQPTSGDVEPDAEGVSYQVIHRYQNLDGETYEEVVDNLRGEENTTVTPSIKGREGFNNPETQTITIEEGKTLTYTYTRKTYTFTITDRTYINNTTTANGTYRYGTEINIKAIEREGFTFKWSDNNTIYERTITLTNNLELTPIYTIDEDYERILVIGENDNISPDNINNYTYESSNPSVVTIDNEGNLNSINKGEADITITNETTGEIFTVHVSVVNDRVVLELNDTDNISPNPEVNYNYTSGNPNVVTVDSEGNITGVGEGSTNVTITNPETGNSAVVNVVVEVKYTITYNTNGGSIDTPTTKIKKGSSLGELPTAILEGSYLEGWYTNLQTGEKVDSNYVPVGDTELFAKWKVSVESIEIEDEHLNIPLGESQPIVINNPTEIEEDYTYETGNPNVATVDEEGNVTATGEGETDITIRGEESGQEITVHIVVTYIITFNANGGTANPNRMIVLEGNSLRNLPEASKDNSYLDGWYTGLTTGIQVDEDYEPHEDTELFARWNNSIGKAEITNEEILLEPTGEEQINITNKDEIDETYTFASTDESVATVDQEGNVTAVGEGETTITITGNESGAVLTINVVVRIPEPTEYTVVFGANGGTGTMEPQTIQKDVPTKLTKNSFTKRYYLFTGWNTEIDGSGTSYTDEQEVTNIGDTTLYAQWERDSFSKVFEQVGECTFNGSSSNITGDACSEYNDKKYIDTGIALYSSENINKDYEVGFTIVEYKPSSNNSYATLFNMRNEATGYPGLAFRKYDSSFFELTSRKTSSSNAVYKPSTKGTIDVKIYRINGEIYYSINGEDKVLLNDLTEYNPEFDLTAWFGAAPKNAEGSEAQRYFVGKLSDMYIKLGAYQEEEKYNITFNPNGGEVNPLSKKIIQGEKVGVMPTPTRTGYYFYSWYLDLQSMITIENNYIPSSDIEIYAGWKKSVASMIFGSEEFSIDHSGGTSQIQITNLNEIEEEFTYTSSDESIVTVDENGLLTGVSDGITTIVITGLSSNQTIEVKVRVQFVRYHITLNENGGSDVEDRLVIKGQSLEYLPTTYKDHSHFDGWYTGMFDGVEVTTSYIPQSDMTLYAHFIEAQDYTITFDVNGGNAIDETTRVVGGDVSVGVLPVPKRDDNLRFAGWMDESENKYYTSNTQPTKDVTLKAQWKTSYYDARINSTYYSSLQSAIDAAEENDEIVLLRNSSSYVTNNKKITINMDKFTMSGRITNDTGGDLTLLNGTIKKTSSTTNDVIKLIINNGDLTLGSENPKLNDGVDLIAKATGYGVTVTAIDEEGPKTQKLIMNGGSITASSSKTSATGIFSNAGSTFIMNGGSINVSAYNSSSTVYAEGFNSYSSCNIIINDGDFNIDSSGVAYAIKPDSLTSSHSSTLVINGGNFNGTSSRSTVWLIDMSGEAVINGGNLTATTETNTACALRNEGPVVVNGGKFIVTQNGDSSSTNYTDAIYMYYSNSRIVFNDGYIDVVYNGSSESSSANGIYNGNIIINGGTIKATSPNGIARGIYSGSTTMLGGIIYSKGSTIEKTYGTSSSVKKFPNNMVLFEETNSEGYQVYYLVPNS